MSRPPLKVLLVADDPEHGGDGGSYLEMLLRLHGRFDVFRDDDEEDGHDAVLVATSMPPRLRGMASDVPVIVLPRWRPDADEVEAMVEDGAEDVLPMAELNGARLEAVVRKAVGRRSRVPGRRIPLRDALPLEATPTIHPWARIVTDEAAVGAHG